MVNVLLDQVAHIKHMEEIERKMIPHVIKNSFSNSMLILQDVNFTPDPKHDDYYTTKKFQDEDALEPVSIGLDPFITEYKIKYQVPQPKVEVVFDEDNLSSIFS